MKKFFCLIMFVGTLFFSGCQIPIDNMGEKEGTEVSINTDNPNDSIKKDTIKEETDKEVNQDNIDKQVDIKKDTSNTDAKQITTVTTYYQDSENTLIPVTRRIEKQEGIGKAALKCMVDSEITRKEADAFGMSPVLPKNTEIRGMNIRDGMVIVDFNEEILNYEDEKSERNIIAGIVYTLTEFKTVDKVTILINGKQQGKLKFGTDISGILSRDNILINSEKVNLKEKIKKLDVYLFKPVKDNLEYVLPVSTEYIGVDENDLPKEIVRLFLKKYESLYSQFPPKVELLDSKVEEKVLILNFNKEIRNYGGTAREEGIIKQILYSMKQIKGVEKVKILIEGKEAYLPEGTDVSKEMLLPVEINNQQ